MSARRVLTRELTRHAGTEVLLQGWVHNIRKIGSLAFLVLRDRAGLAQVVVEGGLLAALPELESVLSVTGSVRADARAPGGAELRATGLSVLARAHRLPPFELNRPELSAGPEVVLEHRVLSLRHPKLHAVFTVQSELVRGFREYLRGEGFTEVHTPKIVATGTEGGSELFPVQYFEQPAYLAQSPQFYKQMLVGAGYERVYEVAPVYRAEQHNTSRHLNEYVSLDLEMGFITGEEEIMALEERLLAQMFAGVAATCEAELALHGVTVPEVREIPRIPLTEAQAILERRFGKRLPPGDLDPESERLLCQYVPAGMVFITRWPRSVRPMYAQPCAEAPALTASFDLLLNGLEVTTGGQRIHDPELLTESIRGRGLDPASFASYLEVFWHGMPPHGGFAIGAERLTARLLGLGNVREACAFPRDRTRLTP